MWLVATVLVIVFLVAIRIFGFRMWEMPFVLFGGALFLYTIFAWRPN